MKQYSHIGLVLILVTLFISPGLFAQTNGFKLDDIPKYTNVRKPTISWSAPADNRTFELRLGYGNKPENAQHIFKDIKDTTFTVPIKLKQQNYFVFLTAKDSQGKVYKAENSPQYFYMDLTAPGTFDITGPQTRAFPKRGTANVEWSAARDSYGKIGKYKIFLSNNKGTNCQPSLRSFEVDVDDTPFDPKNPNSRPVGFGDLTDGKYFFCMSVEDRAGNTSWAKNNDYEVTLDTTAPGNFTFTAPVTTADSQPTIQWTKASDAVEYEVKLIPVLPVSGSNYIEKVNSTSCTTKQALAHGSFRVNVTAIDSVGNRTPASNNGHLMMVDRSPDLTEELQSSFEVGVLVINNLPIGSSGPTQVLRGNQQPSDKITIDCKEKISAKNFMDDVCPTVQTAPKVNDYLSTFKQGAKNFARFIEESTHFHKYANNEIVPGLKLKIVEQITVLQSSDFKNDPLKQPGQPGYRRGNNIHSNEYRDNFRHIFTQANICSYVKDHNVRVVFYHVLGNIPAETFSAGPRGNVGNSETALKDFIAYCRRDGSTVTDPKDADFTYHAIGYSGFDSEWPHPNAMHVWGHHLEAIFGHIDNKIWSTFEGVAGKRFSKKCGHNGVGNGLNVGEVCNAPTIQDQFLNLPADSGIQIKVVSLNNGEGVIRIDKIPGQKNPPQTISTGLPVVTLAQDVRVKNGQYYQVEGMDIAMFYMMDAGPQAKFILERPSLNDLPMKRCGNTHFPPNAMGDYDYWNSQYKVRSDCDDWKPDMSGAIASPVDCHYWNGTPQNTTCTDESENGNPGTQLAFYRRWNQNIPGRNNSVIWNEGGKTLQMRNLWSVIYDMDAALSLLPKLYYEIPKMDVGIPSAVKISAFGKKGVKLTWNAALGVKKYNIFRSERKEGPYYRVNEDANKTTTFIDTVTLYPGSKYFYQVKSLNDKDVQSELGATGEFTFTAQ